MTDISAIVTAFEKAVSKGNVNAAKETAQKLAQFRAKLSIDIISVGAEVPADQWFRLNVKLESATDDMPPTPVPLQVSSGMTIYALKVKMVLLYSIPIDCQRWIIGKKVAKNEETLGSLPVKDQSKVFLYVLEPEAVSSVSNQSQVTQQKKDLKKFRDKLMRSGADPDLAMTETDYNVYLQNMNASNSRAHTPQHSDTHWFPGTQQTRGPPNHPTYSRLGPQPTTEHAEAGFRYVEWDGIRGNEGAPPPGPNGDFMDGAIDTDGYSPPTQTIQHMKRPQQLPIPPNRPAPPGRQRQAPPQLIPRAPRVTKPTAKDVGWSCEQCTFINPPTIPACRSCLHPRPDGYDIPPPDSYIMDADEERLYMQLKQSEILLKELEEEEAAQQQVQAAQNRQQMMQVASQNLVTNTESFECPVCFAEVEPNEGVKLRECLHEICRDCLENHINISNEPEVKCPYTDGDNNCEQVIPDREIRQIISEGDYNRYLQRGLNSAEAAAADAFHCKSPDCVGLCFYDDEINFFDCEVCGHQNCLTCKAIHEGQNCKQYQEELKIKAGNDDAAKKTHEALQHMVKNGEAMHCPKCGIIIQKKSGCDWMQCSVCKVEICWCTKGPRWGPKGRGDSTGGCKCNVNGTKCHPNCGNCH